MALLRSGKLAALVLLVVAVAAQQASAASNITSIDQVDLWLQLAFRRFRAQSASPIVASRTLAMLSIAQFESALDARRRLGEQETGTESAVAGASYVILAFALPDVKDQVADVMHEVLGGLPDCSLKATGLQIGYDRANAILRDRVSDNSCNFVNYETKPPGLCGQWQKTSNRSAVGPEWAYVRPFAIPSPSAFRAQGPPPYDSELYKHDFEEIRLYGAKNSQVRTADQTNIALYWSDAPGTFTPPGHWNAILLAVFQKPEYAGTKLVDKLRAFALMNIAMADAAIATWDMKYHFNHWRPLTAIHHADWCTQAQLTKDDTWEPLIYTPDFPDYTSGHSTFSGAAAAVLAGVFCTDNITFSVRGEEGSTRSFDSFSHAGEEAGRSRVYGGIHFEFASLDGREAGIRLGQYVLATKYPRDPNRPCTLAYQKPTFVVDYACPGEIGSQA